MTTYRPASEVRRIAEQLIPKWHSDLVHARIEYVFRDAAAKSGGKEVWGKARKISGLNAYLTLATGVGGAMRALVEGATDGKVSINGVDIPSDVAPIEDYFVIEIAEDVWAELSKSQREALVDHELSHCKVELTKELEEKLTIVGHDLEEFRAVVERHGLWRPDLEEFDQSMRQGTLDLYADGNTDLSDLFDDDGEP